jgi:hypothetical protein
VDQGTLENGGHFNFPKMYALRHFVPQIERFCSLLGFDSSPTEVSNRFSNKNGYNGSNRNATYPEQILNHNARNEQLATRDWNISAVLRISHYTHLNPNHSSSAFQPIPSPAMKSRRYDRGHNNIREFRDSIDKIPPARQNSLHNLTLVSQSRLELAYLVLALGGN